VEEEVATPIRVMATLLGLRLTFSSLILGVLGRLFYGLRRLRANVTVPFKLEFAKILSSIYFWAPSPK
jgi:hypothetical protein